MREGDRIAVEGVNLFDLNYSVFLYGDRISCVYVLEKFVAEGVDNGHFNAVKPYVGKNYACACK